MVDGHPVGALGCQQRNNWLYELLPMAAPAANHAKFRLKVEVWAGPMVGIVAALCSNGPAVFAVFAGNYQRQAIPAPQKYPIAGGVVKGRTAGQRQIRAGSSSR